MTMRRRINNKAQWTNERWKSLGKVGDYQNYVEWRRNGIYKSVQYEFSHSDNSDFVLMSASENIEVLGR